MVRRASLVAVLSLLLAGCVTQQDVRKPLQEHLLLTGRIMGFALDAQTEALETKLALIEADPKLEEKLHTTAAEVRKKIETVKGEQRALTAEFKAVKDRYPASEDK